jgi:hypothetical protein
MGRAELLACLKRPGRVSIGQVVVMVEHNISINDVTALNSTFHLSLVCPVVAVTGIAATRHSAIHSAAVAVMPTVCWFAL